MSILSTVILVELECMVHKRNSINTQELIEDQGKIGKDLGLTDVGHEGVGGVKGNCSLSHLVIRVFVVSPIQIGY